MILRKPYAFFIKHFKVIHFIMAILMGILIIQTNSFLNFFNGYINSNDLILGRDIVREIFNNFSYIYILLIILMDVMIWVLMDFKKKKRLFYSLNFIGFILLMVIYIYMNNTLESMGEQIVDIRLLMVLRDLAIITFSVQAVFLFLTVIRAIGINIKQFDFQSDLKDLELLESDNEEFEVNLEFDYEKLKRSLRTTMRNFKYYLKENVRIILPIISVVIILLGVFIYNNTRGYTTEYKQGQTVSYPDYSIIVKESYITNKSYDLNNITDDSVLMLIKADIKTTTNKPMFEFGRFSLRIGENKYYHDIKYVNYLKDLGTGYVKQRLTSEYKEYLLIFKIPQNLIEQNMSFVYVNNISAGIFGQDQLTIVSLNPKKLDQDLGEIVFDMNETVLIENEANSSYQLLLENVEISDVFKIKYEYSITNTNEKFEFYKPLQAPYYGSYDKALLKVKLSLKFDNYKVISDLDFIKMYGNLEYKIDGKSKTVGIESQVIPSRVNSGSYYFEIPYEVLNAEEVKLKFMTRKKAYVYDIK